MKSYGKMIGRGAFSKVYKNQGEDFVTIVSNDPAKDCAALFPVCSDHFAKIERIGFDGDNYVYRMEYLEKTGKIKENVSLQAWQFYRLLAKDGWSVKGYHEIRDWFESLPDCDEKEALLEYVDNFANYCNKSMRFEISPRNVRVKDGKIVFLDCFFCATVLESTRK